jgi:hypothetical protein
VVRLLAPGEFLDVCPGVDEGRVPVPLGSIRRRQGR